MAVYIPTVTSDQVRPQRSPKQYNWQSKFLRSPIQHIAHSANLSSSRTSFFRWRIRGTRCVQSTPSLRMSRAVAENPPHSRNPHPLRILRTAQTPNKGEAKSGVCCEQKQHPWQHRPLFALGEFDRERSGKTPGPKLLGLLTGKIAACFGTPRFVRADRVWGCEWSAGGSGLVILVAWGFGSVPCDKVEFLGMIILTCS